MSALCLSSLACLGLGSRQRGRPQAGAQPRPAPGARRLRRGPG